MTQKAVVLLSGGLDSATTLAVAKANGHQLYGITFDYGQRHIWELEAAKKIAKTVGLEQHIIYKLDLSCFGGSALTDRQIPVPQITEEKLNTNLADQGIPPTYVPARNTIFLSIALGWAEVLGAFHIYLGANAIDYSGYPDCRPEFIQAFENLASLATKAGVEGRQFRIHTPLIHMTKKEIIQKGLALGVDFRLTHSCYSPDEQGVACGRCASCQIRLRGFQEANLQDPIEYQFRPSSSK
ncbi:MAG: 7-cyano-7-deazaguanine synthase QueC [Planctomycetota bacterium]|nr:MAG: 7-cyano-7-deazaguanine synthase QueC [Planctomycetota bacterium]